MLRRVISLLTGPTLSQAEREEITAYLEKEYRLVGLQDREAQRYNATLTRHINNLDRPDSVKAVVDASRRLSLCGKELVRRHSILTPVPDLAGASYGAWHLVYMGYSEWADASHEAFVALSQGMRPGAQRVQQLLAELERQRRTAEREDKKLVEAVGLKASELQRLVAAAQEEVEGSDWEPADE